MTADTIARLTAILALDPTDAAAKAEMARVRLRAGISPRKSRATPRRSPFECKPGEGKPKGWRHYLVEIDRGRGGSTEIAAPNSTQALSWGRTWTEGGHWPCRECEARVSVTSYVWSGGKWWPDHHAEEHVDVIVGDPNFDDDDE